MASGTINKPGFHVSYADGLTLTGDHMEVTAPTVSGYRFVCWLSVTTVGWISALYFENPALATTNVWNTSGSVTSKTIRPWALYIKA